MENYLRSDQKAKLKGLAYYQIAGGALGIFAGIWLLANSFNSSSGFIVIVSASLYAFSVYCGMQLLKSKSMPALRLSTISQTLQIIGFAIGGFAFKYASGVILALGIDLTTSFEFTFNMSLSVFQLNINMQKELALISINIIPVFLIIFIGKLQNDIQKFEVLYNSTQEAQNETTLQSFETFEEKQN